MDAQFLGILKTQVWMLLNGNVGPDMETRLREIAGDVPEDVFMAVATYLQACDVF